MLKQPSRISKPDKYHYLILVLILLIGLSFRLYGLSYQSIWLDEAHSIYHSQQSMQHIITFLDPTPPLYYGILHYWIIAFGDSAFAVRMLSVVFGILVIIMLYILARSLFNRTVGLYAALFSSISPMLIYYSQEARVYSMLFLLSLMSIYFFYRWMHKPKTSIIFWYVLSTILLIYSHVFGILIVVVQNIYLLYIHKFKLKKIMPWLWMQLILVISFIPWLIRLPSILQLNYMVWLERPSLLQIAYMIYDFFGGAVISIFGISLTILGIFLVFKSRSKNASVLSLLMLWVLLPIILPIIYSLIFSPVFLPRYVYYVMLPLILLMSISIVRLKKNARIAFTLVMIVLSLLTLYIQQTTITKDPWNTVSADIKSSGSHPEAIFLMSTYEALPFAYYYDTSCFQNATLNECLNTHSIYPENSFEDIRAHGGNDVWLIISRGMYNNDTVYALNYFRNNYHELSHKQYLMNQDYDISNVLLEKIQKNYTQRYNIIDAYHFEKSMKQ